MIGCNEVNARAVFGLDPTEGSCVNRDNGVSVRMTVWEPWLHMETIMMPRHEEKLNKSSVSGERERNRERERERQSE